MFKAGIIDPVKVVRAALTNAASIAGLMLTTEALVTDVRQGRQGQEPRRRKRPLRRRAVRTSASGQRASCHWREVAMGAARRCNRWLSHTRQLGTGRLRLPVLSQVHWLTPKLRIRAWTDDVQLGVAPRTSFPSVGHGADVG